MLSKLIEVSLRQQQQGSMPPHPPPTDDGSFVDYFEKKMTDSIAACADEVRPPFRGHGSYDGLPAPVAAWLLWARGMRRGVGVGRSVGGSRGAWGQCVWGRRRLGGGGRRGGLAALFLSVRTERCLHAPPPHPARAGILGKYLEQLEGTYYDEDYPMKRRPGTLGSSDPEFQTGSQCAGLWWYGPKGQRVFSVKLSE